MIPNLGFEDLKKLLHSVFAFRPNEKGLTIFVDLPSKSLPDNDTWRDRRQIAAEWSSELRKNRGSTPFAAINLCVYENVGSNNNDLPEAIRVIPGNHIETSREKGEAQSLIQILSRSSIVLAMTELSATAPLKVLGRELGFRGATLPGFTRAMIPTLALDYEKVNDRVMQFKSRMDEASSVIVKLSVGREVYQTEFDLRFRSGHASGGLMREDGMVGNLPSGEAYIVPYEGEKEGEPSKSQGLLPVQFGEEIVVYRITNNRAMEVLSQGKHSDQERTKLMEDPAYGNIAEVGIGVLGEWGVTAIGSTLVDEKLGLHIAFGRSEHFGGITSPASFKNPKNVIHIDRVYVPSTQPLIAVTLVSFNYPDGRTEKIIESGKYCV